jgi:ERCC4-type nuclease
MSGRGILEPDSPDPVVSPFVVLVDTREQKPYTFDRLWSGPAGKSPRIVVRTQPAALAHGDYGLQGFSGIAIERKSKEDLYASVSLRRDNFTKRLDRMEEDLDWAAVVVECEWGELLTSPPRHTQYSPKSLTRTMLAWMQRYPRIHWIFAPSRDHAEAFTYRLLERYHTDHKSI